MAYVAIVTCCYQYHWVAGLFCFGVCLGVESGRKTQYTVWLMIPAGLTMAALFAFAISTTFAMGIGNGSNTSYVLGFTRSPAKYSDLFFWSQIAVWALAIGSLIWFIYAWSTVNASSQSLQEAKNRRTKLEELVREKRESIR